MNEWYNLSVDEAIERLSSRQNGLTEKEAKERLTRYGTNELPKQNKDNILKIFINELKDPIVLVLLVTIIFCLIIA